MHSSPQEAGIIPVELKRKQEYKNSYIRPQLVDLPKVVKHVRRLQERKNPYFKDISLNLADYEEVCAKEDPVGHDMIFGGDNDVTTAEPDDKHAKFVNDGRESADAAKPDQHREGANLIGLMDCLTMAEPDDEHKEDVHDGEQAADAVDPDNEDKDEDDSFKALMDELAEANPDGNVDLFMLILWYRLDHLAWQKQMTNILMILTVSICEFGMRLWTWLSTSTWWTVLSQGRSTLHLRLHLNIIT